MTSTLQHFQFLNKQSLQLSLLLSCNRVFIYNSQQNVKSRTLFPRCLYNSAGLYLETSGRLNKEHFNALTFDHVSNETLESLSERLEELLEVESAPADGDITLATNVLTLKLGPHGTYVINKQTPNKQIWLSSPVSGPKRYNFQSNTWIYKHDGTSLHDLLNSELSKIFNMKITLNDCDYGSRKD